MELNIILHYDSNIKTFINNLNLPDELISKINLNIFIIYTDNSIVQDINSNFNINYYNLLNVNDILKKNILENNKNIVPIIQKRLENIYTYINTINEELNELENDIENKENNNYILNEIIQLTKLENNYNIIKKILI